MATTTAIARSALRTVTSRATTSRLSSAARPQWQPQAQQPFLRCSRPFSVSAATLEKRYTKDHEWIEQSSQSPPTLTLGISSYAANALGDVVYIELPQISTQVAAGDAIGAVESVKSASDIFSPVTGTVTEINKLLEEKPGTVNKAPEGEGWIAKVEVEGDWEKDAGELMSKDEYTKFTEEV